MPSREIDLSDFAAKYVMANIVHMAGNPGQEALLKDLAIDSSSIATIYVAGPSVDLSTEGNVNFTSNHPDAIDVIINKAGEHFDEFTDKIIYKETNFSGGSKIIYNQNIIETIREYAIKEAFDSL